MVADVDPEVEARQRAEEERRQEMQTMFTAYDEDGSGTIDAVELQSLLSALGLPLDELALAGVLEEMKFLAAATEKEAERKKKEGRFSAMSSSIEDCVIDDDEDEEEEEELAMDFESFMKIVGAQNSAKDMEVKEIWPLFDTDGDGSLSREELQQVLNQCGMATEQEDFDKLWLSADKAQPDEITFEEFSRASSDGVWKKTLAMMSLKQEFGERCVKIADSQKKWVDLLTEREEHEFDVDRAYVLKRSAMRESPQVKEAIWQMWTVFDGLRPPGSDLVGKALFKTYFLKVGKVILGDEDFDLDDMSEMANEEWERQGKRCAEKRAKNGEQVKEGDGLDFDIFFESMFEMIDYEVSGRGPEYVAPATYAGFVTEIQNKLVVEKISNGTKKWQKGKPVTELERLGRNWVWLHPDDLNYTGKSGIWESIDRKEEAIVLAKIEAEKAEKAKKKAAKKNAKAPTCAKVTTGGGDPRTLFNRIDVNGDKKLDFDELQMHLSDEGLDDATIESLMLLMDTNHDGVVDEQEFVNGWKHWRETVKKQAIEDLNKDRYGGTLQTSRPLLPMNSRSNSPAPPPIKLARWKLQQAFLKQRARC